MDGYEKLAIALQGDTFYEDRITRAKSILSKYMNGATLQEIASEYNISRVRVLQIIARFPEYEKKYKSYTRLNETECLRLFSFGENTPFSAWLVGIIYGDGSISKSGISIGMKDADVIENINSYFNNGLYTRDHNKAKYINFNNRRLVRELYDLYGLVPNKSDKLIWPKLPDYLYPHFIRGLVDSDGYYGLNGYGWLRFSYRCCSEQFMCDFRDYLSSIPLFRKDIKVTKTHQNTKHKPQYGFYLGGIHAKRFGDYIYKNSDGSIRGDRKYQTYTGAIVRPLDRLNIHTQISVKEHYYEWGLTIPELCEVFNLTEYQVKYALNKTGNC